MRNYNQGQRISRSRGFGDTVAKSINKYTNIRPKKECGCKKRQEMLNRMFPYRR